MSLDASKWEVKADKSIRYVGGGYGEGAGDQ